MITQYYMLLISHSVRMSMRCLNNNLITLKKSINKFQIFYVP
ncbi:hypothetical protein DMN91_007431 [Ooceraea biroi]|uniref:Uncharacterized protein n=1 Tax=Ooceraea biroi TaxID=2015173 RepID=A0A3L8DK80_OOCBI|nr:hypothetical protein DMN91_007431 [Ooceraea biroi]